PCGGSRTGAPGAGLCASHPGHSRYRFGVWSLGLDLEVAANGLPLTASVDGDELAVALGDDLDFSALGGALGDGHGVTGVGVFDSHASTSVHSMRKSLRPERRASVRASSSVS